MYCHGGWYGPNPNPKHVGTKTGPSSNEPCGTPYEVLYFLDLNSPIETKIVPVVKIWSGRVPLPTRKIRTRQRLFSISFIFSLIPVGVLFLQWEWHLTFLDVCGLNLELKLQPITNILWKVLSSVTSIDTEWVIWRKKNYKWAKFWQMERWWRAHGE